MTSPAFVVAGAISANNRVLSFRSAMLGSTVSRKSFNIVPYRRAIFPNITPTATAEETAQETAQEPTEQEQDTPAVSEPTSVQEPVVNQDSTEQPVAQAESTNEDSEETSKEQTTAENQNAASKGGEKRRRRRPGNKEDVTLPLDKMTVGMELEGVVKSVTTYGAFVGGMGTSTDGLLHVSQLTTGFVQNVTDIVNVGDKVNVRVLAIDNDKGNFSLTMKTAEEMAASDNKGRRREGGQERGSGGSRREEQSKKWAAFKFDSEVFIDAKVVSVTDFGAFCQLLKEDGEPNEMSPTDGLVHISEISEDHVQSVQEKLSIGQMVKVRVISTDRKRKRISLSMKSASSDSGSDANIAKDIALAEENQPTFKTSFEIAFEKAKAGAM